MDLNYTPSMWRQGRATKATPRSIRPSPGMPPLRRMRCAPHGSRDDQPEHFVRRPRHQVASPELRRALSAQWAAQQARIAQAEGENVTVGEGGRPFTPAEVAEYEHANTRLDYGDWLRSREIADFFSRTGFALPEPGSPAFDGALDYEDVKLKLIPGLSVLPEPKRLARTRGPDPGSHWISTSDTGPRCSSCSYALPSALKRYFPLSSLYRSRESSPPVPAASLHRLDPALRPMLTAVCRDLL
jgi:hypothetical protein